MLWRSETLVDQILTYSDEVVPSTLLVLADRGLVPARTKFTTSAKIGENIGSAVLKP